jgi:hypothetical protein
MQAALAIDLLGSEAMVGTRWVGQVAGPKFGAAVLPRASDDAYRGIVLAVRCPRGVALAEGRSGS